MQTLCRWASLVLFALVGGFLVWFGFTYATVQEMLWFHAAALPESARAAASPLYFALMTLIGAASAALGLLSLYVAAAHVRRRARGAASALVLVNAIVFGAAAITAEELAAATGSPTSWHIMGALMGVTLLAFFLHAIAGARPR